MGEMQNESDAQLLRAYAERGAEAAFAELVQRHTDLVYSAAWRQVESPDIAREIAQGVFISLARGARDIAPRLTEEASLAGWLCRSARNQSLNHRRDEFRRQTRERHAMEQFISSPNDAPDWEQLRRVLDDAMAQLDEADYDAVVLRFFQNRDFRALGAAIGVSDDTAQKRVVRALEKLRELLAQRGIRTTAGALGIAITANAVTAAPVGLAATIASAATIAGTTTATTIIMTTLQKIAVTAALTVTIGSGLFAAKKAHDAQKEVRTLQAQQTPLAEQVQQLQNERARATNTISWLKQELAKNASNNTELLKLRGEIGIVRNQLADAKRTNEKVEQPPLATGQAYLKRSYEHGAKREFEAELDDLNHAIELDPTLAQAYRERAGLYSRLPADRGGEKQAIADYSQCLELKPNDVSSLLMRAGSYEKLRDYDKSISDYTAVIESINQNTADFSNVYMGNNTDKSYWMASAYTMRAQIYKVDKHDYSSAIADYTATIQLNPISPNSYRSRGECYEAIGETAEARQDFAIEPKRSF
jgi:RNA polymerase sigma factor (sigma-70 family)